MERKTKKPLGLFYLYRKKLNTGKVSIKSEKEKGTQINKAGEKLRMLGDCIVWGQESGKRRTGGDEGNCFARTEKAQPKAQVKTLPVSPF